MQLKELKINIHFEYIKEIRKYIYDIESFLKESKFCDSIDTIPSIPDDIEPHMPRLSTTKNEKNKLINIVVSQASISILLIYKKSTQFTENFDEDLAYLSNISKDLKKFIKSKNDTFKINYEGLVSACSTQILKDDELLMNKYNLDSSSNEVRSKISKDIDSKHVVSVEKSLVRFYTNQKKHINEMSIKHNYDSIIGWNSILVIEIHNRLEYNNSNDEEGSLELDMNFAATKTTNVFNKESNL